MSDLMLLRLPAQADDPVQWLSTSAEGMALSSQQSGSLADAAQAARGKRVCCLVGGADVLLTQAELPLRSGSRLGQVAAYALEDQIVGDVEQLHFAVGRRDEATRRTPVAAVARDLLRDWLARLANAGISPVSMYAESSLLPANPAQSVALLERGQLLLAPAGGTRSPITLPAGDLASALGIGLHGEPLSGQHLLLYVAPAEWRERQAQFEQLRPRVASVNVQVLNGGTLPWFATQVGDTGLVNLLQGEFAPRGASTGDWRRWRVAAALAVAALAFHGAAQFWQRSRLTRAEAAVDQELNALDQRHFGGTIGAAGLRKAVEQRLLASGSASSFLPAVQAVANASAGTGALLESLDFSEQSLHLKLLAPAADSIEQLAQKLKSAGWNPEILSGAARGQQFESQLDIKVRKS